MEFKYLKNAISKKYQERFKGYEEDIKTEEGLKKVVGYPLNKREDYKGTFEEQQKKALISLKKKLNKEFEKETEFIKSVEEFKDFSGEFIITLEWKKSYMWGSNPRAYTNYGFVGESISGCGYCKTSTATAQALNSNLSILKLLFKMEDERLKQNEYSLSQLKVKSKHNINKITKDRRDYINYGCGYNVTPKFEGGVGVSSHEQALKKLGLKMRCISDTSQTNVYLIRKMNKQELKDFKEKGY